MMRRRVSESTQTGHLHIETDDIGIKRLDSREGFGAAAGGPDNGKAGFGSDHARESGTHESAIVDDEHSDLRVCDVEAHVR